MSLQVTFSVAVATLLVCFSTAAPVDTRRQVEYGDIQKNPFISSIAPMTGNIGTKLTAHGRNLMEGGTKVKVGDAPCELDTAASTSIAILCTVMRKLPAGRHEVVIKNDLGVSEAANGVLFTVLKEERPVRQIDNGGFQRQAEKQMDNDQKTETENNKAEAENNKEADQKGRE
eukprot:m.158900 g.158900  ORF g.158900 m.158900 type:complete len:173 (-) comp15142_c0_seq1:157-675(-)